MASPEAELVPLLYRADWRTWSFSAVASIRMRRTAPSAEYRILIAPGGRYRVEPLGDADFRPAPWDDDEPVSLIVCDGEFRWEVRSGEADRFLAGRDERPIEPILHPARLVAGYRLTVTGAAEYAGRRVHVVEGSRRAWPLALPRRPPLGSVSALIDVETGVVLRSEVTAGQELLEVVELRDFTVQPPPGADASDFRLPAGVTLDECDDEDELDADELDAGELPSHERPHMPGPAMAGLKLAAQAAERAIKRQAEVDQQADSDAAMPEDTDELDKVQPVSDLVLNLIARTGQRPLSLAATAHTWIDADITRHAPPVGPIYSVSSFREGASGLFGPGGFAALVSTHRSAALRVIMPDRYRVDVRAGQRRNNPATIACDGQRLRKVYGNRVVVSPPQPLPPEYARLLEPAWLLNGWRLSEAGRVQVSGRTAIRLIAEPPPAPVVLDDVAWRMVLLIDADLGFLLRQVTYAGTAPAARFELRDLHVDPADPGDFGVEVPPGVRVVESGGDLWHEMDLPGPALAAGEAAGSLVRAAVSAASWLASARRRR